MWINKPRDAAVPLDTAKLAFEKDKTHAKEIEME